MGEDGTNRFEIETQTQVHLRNQGRREHGVNPSTDIPPKKRGKISMWKKKSK